MRATNDFTVPDNLLGLAGADERSRFDASASLPGSAVTYTLRFYTGDKMGSGLTTPDAGVQVMLISADGRAFMQRVDRYPDVGEADANLALYSLPSFQPRRRRRGLVRVPRPGLPRRDLDRPGGGRGVVPRGG